MKAVSQKVSGIFSKFRILQGTQDLDVTIRRFPLSVVSALVMFVIGLCEIFDVLQMRDKIVAHSMIFCVIGFFWFGVVQLLSESHGLNALKKYVLSFVGALFFYFIIFWSAPEADFVGFGLRFFTIIGALVVFVSAAPFFLRQSQDAHYWHFGQRVFFGAFVAFVAALVLQLGVWAAITSVKYLFDLNFISLMKFTQITTLFASTLLGPIYALCFVPKTFQDDESTREYPKQVGFFADWIMAPLVVLYIIILYAYFGKILVNWEIPKGLLSYMIAGFGAAGLITYIVSWPCVKDGKAGKLLNFIHKYFFHLFIIPVMMQAVAIGMRINQYGITEKRYIVVAVVLWFALLTIGFTLKKLQLKHIAIIASILLFLSSWGPWGMKSVSFHSQMGRLQTLLVDNNLLQDGELVKQEEGEALPFDVRQEISSTYRYLSRQNGRYKNDFELYNTKGSKEFYEKTGFNEVFKYQNNQKEQQLKSKTFRYSFNEGQYNTLFDVRKVDYFLSGFNVNAYNKKNNKHKIDEGRYKKAFVQKKKMPNGKEMQISLEGNILRISIEGWGAATTNLLPVVQKMLEENPAREAKKELYPIRFSSNLFRVRIMARNINGSTEGDLKVLGISGQMYITRR